MSKKIISPETQELLTKALSDPVKPKKVEKKVEKKKVEKPSFKKELKPEKKGPQMKVKLSYKTLSAIHKAAGLGSNVAGLDLTVLVRVPESK